MKKIFTKNLYVISTTLIGLFSFTIVKAQIVYTSLRSGISLKCDKPNCSKTYSLDLNNDGTADFNITVHTSATTPERGIYITPLNGDSVVVPAQVIFGPISYNPSALVEGYVIGPALTWRNSAYPAPGNPPFMYLKGYNYVCHFDVELGCGYYYDFVGGWPDKGDRYLGLKIISNGHTYYGWARLSVSVTASKWTTSCKIKDYAFENTPNAAITAGNAGTSAVTKSSPNNEPENHDVHGLKLTVAPNPISISVIISFALQVARKVSLRIYDMNGRLISTLADREFVAGTQHVKWNTGNLNTGIYILRMETTEVVHTRKLFVMKYRP